MGSPNSRIARCANRDARYRKVSITHGTVRNKDFRHPYGLMKIAASQVLGSLFYVNNNASAGISTT